MNKFVWLNPYLPQTLQISVIIAYFSAAFSLLGFLFPFMGGRLSLIEIIVMGLAVLGAFGIANLRWWGYIIALFVAFLPFVLGIVGSFVFDYTIFEYLASLIAPRNLISTIFNIAIVALLVHPMSRDYVKRNFEKTVP
jgi:hypothetical protein